jgi:hypothetical protein
MFYLKVWLEGREIHMNGRWFTFPDGQAEMLQLVNDIRYGLKAQEPLAWR